MNSAEPRDDSAWNGCGTELPNRLKARLAAVTAVYGIPAHDAEDLVQESLLALLAREEVVRSPEQYLLGILRRQCAAHIRQRYQERHVVQVGQARLEALAGSSIQHNPGALDARLDFASLLDTLPQSQAAVLLLRFLGFHHDEIAAACRRAAPTVRRDAMRAIAKLQALD